MTDDGGDASTVVTHISSLGEDLVLEIFLRLSSLATLVRAALTCRAWRRTVASSPDFRRRFRALHPEPPLLGIFFSSVNYDAPARPPCVPSFVPSGFRDWDLAGAVGGGDFLLTSLLKRSTDNSYPYWQILDCCGGRVLLGDFYAPDNPLIVLNPMMRRSAHEFRWRYPGPESPDQYQTIPRLIPRLICLDEDSPSSFRVVLLAYSGCNTLQPWVFSSDTGEWSALPAVDVADADGTSGEASETIRFEYKWKLRANGLVYWTYMWCDETGRYWRRLISLDTTTMEFSLAKLPQCLQGHDFTLHAGEAEDGAACIVYSDRYGSNIGVVKHTRGDDGVDRWVADRVLCLDDVVKNPWPWGDDGFDRWVPDDRVFRVKLDAELKTIMGAAYADRWGPDDNETDQSLSVLAVRDGYVYFATLQMLHDPRKRCWIMSLCLATMKVEMLVQRRYDGEASVYIMPWPPCLLASNYGQFAFEGAT